MLNLSIQDKMTQTFPQRTEFDPFFNISFFPSIFIISFPLFHEIILSSIISHKSIILPKHSYSPRLWSYFSPFFLSPNTFITAAFVPLHLSFLFLVEKPWIWIHPLISSQVSFHLKSWLTCFPVSSTFWSLATNLKLNSNLFLFPFSTMPFEYPPELQHYFWHHHYSRGLLFNEKFFPSFNTQMQ